MERLFEAQPESKMAALARPELELAGRIGDHLKIRIKNNFEDAGEPTDAQNIASYWGEQSNKCPSNVQYAGPIYRHIEFEPYLLETGDRGEVVALHSLGMHAYEKTGDERTITIDMTRLIQPRRQENGTLTLYGRQLAVLAHCYGSGSTQFSAPIRLAAGDSPECMWDRDCGGYTFCRHGFCIYPKRCERDAECDVGGGEGCRKGKCLTKCGDDFCPQGYYCEMGNKCNGCSPLKTGNFGSCPQFQIAPPECGTGCFCDYELGYYPSGDGQECKYFCPGGQMLVIEAENGIEVGNCYDSCSKFEDCKGENDYCDGQGTCRECATAVFGLVKKTEDGKCPDNSAPVAECGNDCGCIEGFEARDGKCEKWIVPPPGVCPNKNFEVTQAADGSCPENAGKVGNCPECFCRGNYYAVNGGCQKRGEPRCPDGYSYDGGTKECVSVSETCPDDAQGVPKAADGKCPQFMLPVSNCPHCICEKFYELSPDGRCFLTPPSCSEGMSFNLEQGDCIKPSIVPGAAAEGRSGCGGCSLCAN